MAAFLSGMEQRGRTAVTSRRSARSPRFFVSRLDTEVDRRLAAIGTPDALAMTGKAGGGQCSPGVPALPADVRQ